jgi:hypothetical protein
MNRPEARVFLPLRSRPSPILVLLVLVATIAVAAAPVVARDLPEPKLHTEGSPQTVLQTAKATAWEHQSDAVREPLLADGSLVANRTAGSLSGAALAPGAPWWGLQLYGGYLDATVIEPLRAGWVRVPIEWGWIEPNNTIPENFRWPADFDEELARLAEMDVNVILTLMGNPTWAATYPAGPIDKVDIAELVEFMQAAVARYGVPPYNVKYWEIYNEPDNSWVSRAATGGWGYFGHQPEEYTLILRALYAPIKEVDPDARIVFGGLAYDNWSQGFVKDFLDKVLAGGGGAYFDVMNFHYFNYFQKVWDPYGVDIIGKTTYIRNRLESFGVAKPFVCTEACKGSNPGFGTEELQARYVVQLFARSKEADLDFTVWWWLYDYSDLAMKCGLLTAEGRPMLAYYAYQTLAREMAGTEYVRALSPLETGSEHIEAYQFARVYDRWPVIVAWTNDNSDRTLSLNADKVVVVDKVGNVSVVHDGDDGAVDGLVVVRVQPSPVYLRFQQWYRLCVDVKGQGRVDRSPDLESYQFGDVVKLTPVPAEGWAFDRWSGPDVADLVDGTDGSWSLTMDVDKAVTASFTSPEYEVTVGVVGEGSVEHVPGNPYHYGDVAVLKPIPAEHWSFSGWTGPDASDLVGHGDGTWSLTVNGAKSVTARFVHEQALVTLSVSIQGNGSVVVEPEPPYTFGEVVTLTPIPELGWHFAEWLGDDAEDLLDNEDGTWSLILDADRVLAARFELSQFEVTVTVIGPGSVRHMPGNPYMHGEVATLQPTPADGCYFAGWSGPASFELEDNGDGSWSLVIDGDKFVTARFAGSGVFLPFVARHSGD